MNSSRFVRGSAGRRSQEQLGSRDLDSPGHPLRARDAATPQRTATGQYNKYLVRSARNRASAPSHDRQMTAGGRPATSARRRSAPAASRSKLRSLKRNESRCTARSAASNATAVLVGSER